MVPDRIVLSRQGFVRKTEAGRKDRRETCMHGTGTTTCCAGRARPATRLDAGQAVTLGRLLRKAESVMSKVFDGMPVWIEWALDDADPSCCRPALHLQPTLVPDDICCSICLAVIRPASAALAAPSW